MGPTWATHMGPTRFFPSVLYGSHVGCPYGSQILPTFPPDLARISAHLGPIPFLSTCFIWVPDPAHIFPRSCPPFRPSGPQTVFVHLFHMVPRWVAHMGPRSCPYFPQILPAFPTVWAYTVFVHLFNMGPTWVAHMGPRSCPHFAQILPSLSPIWFLSICFIWVPDPAHIFPRSCPPIWVPYGFCPPV